MDLPPKLSHSEAEFDPRITLNLAFEGFVTTAIQFPDCMGNRSTQEDHRLAGVQRMLEQRETRVLVRGHLRECSEEEVLVSFLSFGGIAVTCDFSILWRTDADP